MKHIPERMRSGQATRIYGCSRHFLKNLVVRGYLKPITDGHGWMLFHRMDIERAMWDYIFSCSMYKICRIHLSEEPLDVIAKQERVPFWIVLKVKKTKFGLHTWTLVEHYLRTKKIKGRFFEGFNFLGNHKGQQRPGGRQYKP